MLDLSLESVFEAILTNPWYGAAPANVVLLVIAIVRLKGMLRALSVILTVTTGAVLGLVTAAYILDPGNLWELLLRMATPPILVLTMGLHLLGLVVRPRQVRASSAHSTPW